VRYFQYGSEIRAITTLSGWKPGANSPAENISLTSRPRADKLFVGAFLQKAEEILAVAAAGTDRAGDLVIVVDRQGGIQMLDPTGWSLPALKAHYGAASLFKVERRGQTVRVEGWESGQRCLLQRDLGSRRLSDLPGFPVVTPSMPFAALLPAA
jgi:hypothetical protein